MGHGQHPNLNLDMDGCMILILMLQSSHNLAHCMRAELPSYVPNCNLIGPLFICRSYMYFCNICLTAPSHYLNECWLIIKAVQWHSSDSNFTRDTPTITKISMNITWIKFHSILPGAELQSMPHERNWPAQYILCVPIIDEIKIWWIKI